MKFKDGDRVHVTRLDGNAVDFYGDIIMPTYNSLPPSLCNCSIRKYNNMFVVSPKSTDFGPDKSDYYTLATNEEDTDKPEIQNITDMNNDVLNHKIELDNHYIIEVKKGSYVQNATSNYFFKFTKDINNADVYEFKNAAMKHAEFVDGRVLNLKRYVEE